MADTLLSFGVQKLWDLLVRESEQFQGFDKQFNKLKSDLNLLRAFLKDADARKHASETVRNFVEEIKEIVFDAEDIIETFLLKEELGQTSGIRKRMRRLSCIVVDRRNIGSDIGGISERISQVTSHMQSFGVQKTSVEDSDTVQERQREIRKTFPDNSENDLVGLEENVKKLVGYLVDEDSVQVVSITGMGGIGKTTLAREVFNHEMVKNHFDGVAWVCISQDFTRTYVWETILQQLTSKHNEQKESNMTEEMLQNKLYRLLETSNSLIVLDDMWKEEDWDRIKHVFPSKKGWKILVTSRNEDVALHADPSCFTFRTDCLTPEESWTLFQRMIASPRENTNELKVDDKMEEMGKQMIKHCGGLPLAIKVLGGLLATQYTLREWERVYENIKSRIVGGISFNDRNISSVYHVLYLSFEELPIYLKHCFLYLAHFPEDRPIDVEKLSYLWAAEEIPRPRYYDEETVREVGDCYIEELVKRNMVISKRDDITSRFETCQLHDMMREVCLFKSGEENFVHIFDTANAQSSCKSRRMAILDNFPKGKMMNPKLRSILFINRNLIAQRVCFTRLQLMRVLDLVGASFRGGKLPSSIGKLIHLRYLNLKWTEVSHLPSSLGNLKLLIYLNLYTLESIFVPNVLMGMQELRYLELPFDMHKKTKLELRNLEKLETLKNFSTKNGSIEDLCGMVRLRTLDIKLEDETSIETLSASIGGLRHLEYLTIEDWSDERMNKVGFVMDFIHLKELELDIYMPRLPKEQHFPSHLTKISLRYCCLEEDPMPILEKLLQLKKVRLWYNSFSGRRMVCSGGGFPQLQELLIGGLMELEEWIVEEGSMPLLHDLTIWDCRKLKEVPDGQHCPCQLTTISIIECCFEEDPMPILEKLLQLKDVRLGIESFSGNRMVCSGGGFPQLHKLEIWRLLELEEWIIEEGSMPLLHTLIITRCEKLKELPDGLRFIYSLKRLEMDKEWKERLSEGGADYYKVQHIPSIEFREDDD